MAAISTSGLSKDYGNGRGLFDLDLEVAEGGVFGYPGPNGAGKTTTIRLLMGLIHPDAGSASIFGLGPFQVACQTTQESRRVDRPVARGPHGPDERIDLAHAVPTKRCGACGRS